MQITQSFLNKKASDLLKDEGWELLYEDLPGGSRSGVGLTAKLNAIWEGLYNLSPDLFFMKDDELLLGEVDNSLNEEYLTKFRKYQSRSEDLISSASSVIGKDFNKLSFLFVAKNDNKKIPPLKVTFLYPNGEELRIEESLLSE